MRHLFRHIPKWESYLIHDPKQIADALKKNLGTIQRWCREGKLPAAKIEGTYIVRRVDFDDWFKSKQFVI